MLNREKKLELSNKGLNLEGWLNTIIEHTQSVTLPRTEMANDTTIDKKFIWSILVILSAKIK